MIPSVKTKRAVIDDGFDNVLGRNFRRIRRYAGVGIEELSGVIHVSVQQIHKYESGKNRFPLERLLIAMEYFGYPAESFLQMLDKKGAKVLMKPRAPDGVYLSQEDYVALLRLAEGIGQLARRAGEVMARVNHEKKVSQEPALV